MATTTNLGLTKPTVGASDNTWGDDLNGNLDTLDGLWAAIGKTAFGQAATKALTFFLQAANNLSDLADATAARGNLGLGSAATQSIGTSGATVPLLNGANTWSGAQTFSGGLSGALTGDVTGNVSGSSGSCTGNAATATNAGHATTADSASNAANLNTGGSQWLVYQRGGDGWLEFNYNGTPMMALSNIDGTLHVRGPIVMNTTP
jgi:hypothetical protein